MTYLSVAELSRLSGIPRTTENTHSEYGVFAKTIKGSIVA